ncbi:MAG: site-specific integrase [Alphaproteobacteria bacterium]|nr:site-specific integrase [Alphaproteobacteria bacterium]
MQNISENTETHSRDGNVYIYARSNGPNYYCQLKKPDTNRWVQRSTGKRNKAEALRAAERLYDEMAFLHSRGYSTTPTDFSKVCDLYLRELEQERVDHEKSDGKAGRNPIDLKTYAMTVERYIKPYFLNKPIDNISAPDIQQYVDWRRCYWLDGPGKDVEFQEYMRAGKVVKKPINHVPAKDGALSTSVLVLRDIFKCAVRHKFLDESRAPKIEFVKAKPANGNLQAKPAFTTAKFQELLEYLPGWCLQSSRDPHLRNFTDRRLLLWDMIELIANTGMRPGTETDYLQWKHIEFYKDKRGMGQEVQDDPYQIGNPRVSISLPKGKNGARPTTGNIDAASALLRIQRRYSDYQNGLTVKPSYYEHMLGGKTEWLRTGWIKPVAMNADMPVSALPNGQFVSEDSLRQTFERLMRDFGTTHDDAGRHFTPYVLRHSYITWQLQAGSMTIHDIAKQVGNSVAVIEKFYDKVNVVNVAHRQKRIQDI